MHPDHIVISGLRDRSLAAGIPADVRSGGKRPSAVAFTNEPLQGFCSWVFPQCKASLVTMTCNSFPNHNGDGPLDEKNPVDYATGYVLIIFALLG